MYMGGKCRLAKSIVPVLQQALGPGVTYYEPFLGGCNILPHVSNERRVGSDIVPDLALLYSAIRDGWLPEPTLSEARYRELRLEPPSAERACAMFPCSFGAKPWGGYARGVTDYAGVTRRWAEKIQPKLVGAEFRCCSYTAIAPAFGDVVYCDPPYIGTTGYGARFDHSSFWDTVRGWVTCGVHVFVSELQAPDDFEAVIRIPKTRGLRRREGCFVADEALWQMKR